jgi:hypothetical protein
MKALLIVVCVVQFPLLCLDYNQKKLRCGDIGVGTLLVRDDKTKHSSILILYLNKIYKDGRNDFLTGIPRDIRMGMSLVLWDKLWLQFVKEDQNEIQIEMRHLEAQEVKVKPVAKEPTVLTRYDSETAEDTVLKDRRTTDV